MPPASNLPSKPIADLWRPEFTRLPALHPPRRYFRRFVHILARALLWLLTRTTISGMENLPPRGPLLFAVNHLGDADAVLVLAAFRLGPEVLGKVELYDFPVVGKLMDWYGTIWLHRGRPDRRAFRCALQAFEQGRSVIVAPEGRYSLNQGLEPGGNGAAWLAARAHVPVVPIAITGTANEHVYGSLRRFRRPQLTLTAGRPVPLRARLDDREALHDDTQRIMHALAQLLPEEDRGVYR